MPNYDPVNCVADRLGYMAEHFERLSDNEVYMPGFSNECGTAHCVCGWAARLPEMVKAMRNTQPGVLLSSEVSFFLDHDFWGITHSESMNLFLYAGYLQYHPGIIPAAAVAKKLRGYERKVRGRYSFQTLAEEGKITAPSPKETV